MIYSSSWTSIAVHGPVPGLVWVLVLFLVSVSVLVLVLTFVVWANSFRFWTERNQDPGVVPGLPEPGAPLEDLANTVTPPF